MREFRALEEEFETAAREMDDARAATRQEASTEGSAEPESVDDLLMNINVECSDLMECGNLLSNEITLETADGVDGKPAELKLEDLHETVIRVQPNGAPTGVQPNGAPVGVQPNGAPVGLHSASSIAASAAASSAVFGHLTLH